MQASLKFTKRLVFFNDRLVFFNDRWSHFSHRRLVLIDELLVLKNKPIRF